MTVSALPRKAEKGEILFVFKNSEDLTDGIMFLFNKKPLIKSSLYKTAVDFRLIITADSRWPTVKTLSEFAKYKTESFIHIAVTREHAKPLILEDAVKTYGKAFLKRF